MSLQMSVSLFLSSRDSRETIWILTLQVQVPARCAAFVFLAPQCAALRCPWVSALLVPVVRVPSCARGLPCVFVYCTCTTNLYCSTVGT